MSPVPVSSKNSRYRVLGWINAGSLDMAKKTQIQKFKDAARELETDDSEKRFDERLGPAEANGA